MADKTEYQLAMLMKYNRDGSPDRQNERHLCLNNVFKHLRDHRGYSNRYKLTNFNRKDVKRLVHDWKEQKLSHETIANRVVHLRWLASKVGAGDAVPKTNKELGLRKRPEPTKSKAEKLDHAKLMTMPERERLITELRANFGLRTEEAVKFQHVYATQNKGVITLKGNWTKGGRPRTIAITNDEQRDLLNRIEVHQVNNGDRSMVPCHRRFKSYYRDYNEVRAEAGIPGHGLRHQWAQDRFKSISGINAPHAGGPAYAELSKDDQAKWDRAAAIVNSELGHGRGRQDITAKYIGAR